MRKRKGTKSSEFACLPWLHANSVDQQETCVCLGAEHVQYVVLDEADKMLSLGLQPQLKRIRALVIPRKPKPLQQGAGVLVKPHTRRRRPQVSHLSTVPALC